MFEYLQKYIPGSSGVNDNFFSPISQERIKKAESLLGFSFPQQLKRFYEEIGTGMLRSPEKVPEGYNFYNSNLILPPEAVANFAKGILSWEGQESYMFQDANELLQPGVGARRSVQQGRKLTEPLCIQAEEHLIEQHRLRLVAGGLEHEIRAILAQ